MAKKPTEKQLYKLKNEWLGQFFEEVKPKEFYQENYPMRRKTPCFSYGDIRRVHRIYASN